MLSCHKDVCVSTLHLDRPPQDAPVALGGSNVMQRCVLCECRAYSAAGTGKITRWMSCMVPADMYLHPCIRVYTDLRRRV